MGLRSLLMATALMVSMSGLRAAEAGLLAHWRFSPEWKQGTDLKAVAGGPSIPLHGPMRFSVDPMPGHLNVGLQDPDLVVAPDLGKALLPRTEMTLEAWVRLEEPPARAGIVSTLDESEDTPSGWMLGVRNQRFVFSLAAGGGSQPVELVAPSTFDNRRWYHLAGTYDGKIQRLFVNGEPVASSTAQTGNITYSPKAPFLVSTFRARGESFRMQGALHDLLLFQRALDAAEIQQRFDRRKAEFPEPAPAPHPLRLAYGPFVDWSGTNSAVVTWETDPGVPSRLILEDGGGVQVTEPETPGTRTRAATLTGLERDREYHYRIAAPDRGGIPVQTRRYLFDTSFHYEPVAAPKPTGSTGADSGNANAAAEAAEILKRSGVRDGYCVVLGATDGRLALELVRQSRLQVVVVDSSEERIASARNTLDHAGVYGVRASVHRASPGPLPYGDLFANLIVSESSMVSGEPPFVPAREVFRILRPEGGTLVLGRISPSSRSRWEQWRTADSPATLEAPDGASEWLTFRRGRLPGAGEWSHQYGSADNSSSSLDEIVNGELQVAWWGDPGPRPMPDRGNRNPAPLSVQGRLFIQGNRILFGLDAYNGSILWTLSAPEVRRANVTRDCSNMAASKDHLYVVHGRWCLQLDGQTGARTRRFPVDGDGSEGRFGWGYVAAVGDSVIGTRQKRDAAYLGDDGEWYEDFDDQQTSRVTSDRMFSTDPESGLRRWIYQGGVILNSTITIADGMILFLESRNLAALEASGSRLAHDQLTDQHLVALDLRTGKPLWETAHDFSDCQYMTYLVYNQGSAVVTGTDRNKVFHTYAFNAPAPGLPGGDDLDKAIPGRLLWSDTHKEDKGHHSGHLQHPLVLDQVFYSDQRAFDLRSGKLLRTDLPERRGCGIMSASRRAVFFRHHYQGMWDLTTNKRSQFEGIRTGCWLGLIPAGGLLLAPESSAGCSCTHAIQTSVAYMPRSQKPN